MEKISTSARIEEEMHETKFETLSGLAQMESKDIALLFYETGFDTFYTALSGCNESLRIAILENVSHRTREIMQEELQLRASPDWVFIEQALEEIAIKALALAARGLIRIPNTCLETKRLQVLIEEREKLVRSKTILAKLDQVSAAINVLLSNSNQNHGN